MTEEEKYDKWALALMDVVEGMEGDELKPQLAVALLLDKAIDLTFHCNTPANAREAVKMMTEEVAERYEHDRN